MTTTFLGWRGLARERPEGRRRVPSAVLGTALFVFAEVMFFCGMISAHLVLRSHAVMWPPVGQPRLPVVVTGINTIALLASGYTMWRARGDVLRGDLALARQWLVATFVLGAAFLAVQGYEWIRLIGFGLTTSSSVYGGLFYSIIGAHAAHVAGALVALGLVLRQLRRGRYTAASHDGLLAMRLFWIFVVGIWPVLYAVVYLW